MSARIAVEDSRLALFDRGATGKMAITSGLIAASEIRKHRPVDPVDHGRFAASIKSIPPEFR